MTHVGFSQQRTVNMTLEGGFGFCLICSDLICLEITLLDIILFDAYLCIYLHILHICAYHLCCSYTSDAICECRDPGPVRYF